MSNINSSSKIVLPGGAGLVGQNLVSRLKNRGFTNITVLDKHQKNLSILRGLHPDIQAHYADLSKEGGWESFFDGAQVVIMLQAQIGGLYQQDFERNNVIATKLILAVIKSKAISKLVHISSSVVESSASDFYTQSKIEQERLVLESGIPCQILRPTLMFGWFDRKHLGWLARLMNKVPIFPIPGDGKYLRQPLYVGDFCSVIISCIENNIPCEIFNITGLQKIFYINIIKTIRKAIKAKTVILKIPYSAFWGLLYLWSIFDKNPPFTTQQLSALVAKDEFEVIDWPNIFSVSSTPFEVAVNETFNDPIYGKVVLEF